MYKRFDARRLNLVTIEISSKNITPQKSEMTKRMFLFFVLVCFFTVSCKSSNEMGPKIVPDKTEFTALPGETHKFTCRSNEPITWITYRVVLFHCTDFIQNPINS